MHRCQSSFAPAHCPAMPQGHTCVAAAQVYMGGIGSYALLVMVAAFLLLHPSRDRDRELEGNLGVLLLDFFRLYGRALNATDVGVSCR